MADDPTREMGTNDEDVSSPRHQCSEEGEMISEKEMLEASAASPGENDQSAGKNSSRTFGAWTASLAQGLKSASQTTLNITTNRASKLKQQTAAAASAISNTVSTTLQELKEEREKRDQERKKMDYFAITGDNVSERAVIDEKMAAEASRLISLAQQQKEQNHEAKFQKLEERKRVLKKHSQQMGKVLEKVEREAQEDTMAQHTVTKDVKVEATSEEDASEETAPMPALDAHVEFSMHRGGMLVLRAAPGWEACGVRVQLSDLPMTELSELENVTGDTVSKRDYLMLLQKSKWEQERMRVAESTSIKLYAIIEMEREKARRRLRTVIAENGRAVADFREMETIVHEMEEHHKEEKEMWNLERAASASEVATARAQLTQMEAALRSSRAECQIAASLKNSYQDVPALPDWAPEEARAAPEPVPEETTDENNAGEDAPASNGASPSCLSAVVPAAAVPPCAVTSVSEKKNVAQAESKTMAATPSAVRPKAIRSEEATNEGLLSALKMAQSELRVMTCRCEGLEQEMQRMRRGQGLDSETASRRIQEAKERARLMEKSILERVKQCDAEELEDSKMESAVQEDDDIFGSSSRASQFKAAVAMLQRQGMFGDDPDDASRAQEMAGGRRSMQARDESADSQFRNALASLNKQGISNESTPQRLEQEDNASDNGNGVEDKKQPPARLGNRLSIFETPPPPASATGEPEDLLPGSGSALRPGKIKILDKFLPKDEERSQAIGESPTVNSQPGKIKILDKFLPKDEEEVVPLARHLEGQRNRATSQFKDSMSKLFSSGEEVAADSLTKVSNAEAKPAEVGLAADDADKDETAIESEAKSDAANPGADENECADAHKEKTTPESEAMPAINPMPEEEESTKEIEELSAVNKDDCNNDATTAPTDVESGSVQPLMENNVVGEQEVLTSPSKEWVQVGRMDGTLEEEEAQI